MFAVLSWSSSLEFSCVSPVQIISGIFWHDKESSANTGGLQLPFVDVVYDHQFRDTRLTSHFLSSD